MNLSKRETRRLANGRCPDCNGERLRAGPCAGMSQNIACALCGSEFVFVDAAPGLSTRNTQKGRPDRERLKAVYGIELR
jgi:hypothetical protein